MPILPMPVELRLQQWKEDRRMESPEVGVTIALTVRRTHLVTDTGYFFPGAWNEVEGG